MSRDRQMQVRAGSFGGIADTYERYRPPYPDALFDDVATLVDDRGRPDVLEVGAGGGRATLPLAHRGIDVVALEPSAGMAAVLRSRLASERPPGRVTVRQRRFEDLSPADEPFGVVVAAQSFHWADPGERWARLASLLADDGVACIFWNEWAIDPERHDVGAALAAYRRLGPGLVPDVEEGPADISWAASEIVDEPALTLLGERSFDWALELPRRDYLTLLRTTSQYVVAPEWVVGPLLNELGGVLGSTVSLQGRTVLVTTSRCPGV